MSSIINDATDNNIINLSFANAAVADKTIAGLGNKSFYIAVSCVTTTLEVRALYKVGQSLKKYETMNASGSNSIIRNTIGTMKLNSGNMKEAVVIDKWIGASTSENPYEIYDREDLNNMGKGRDGNGDQLHFEQQCTIPLDDTYTGVNNFHGVYDGNNQKIQNNSNQEGFENLGSNATLKNMDVEANVNGEIIGIIVNQMKGEGCTISNCMVSGSVTAGLCGGGIVGMINLSTITENKIENCTNHAVVSGQIVGGICGNSKGGVTFKGC